MDEIVKNEPGKRIHSRAAAISIKGSTVTGGIILAGFGTDGIVNWRAKEIKPALQITSTAFALSGNHLEYNYINLKNFLDEKIKAATLAQDHEIVLSGNVTKSDVALNEHNSLTLPSALALQHFIDRHPFICKWLMFTRESAQRTP